MPTDTIFQMTGSTVRYGDGATREVGADFVDLGCRRVLAIIDPAVRAQYPGETALASLRSAGVDFDVFTDVRCEPTEHGRDRAPCEPGMRLPRDSLRHPQSRVNSSFFRI